VGLPDAGCRLGFNHSMGHMDASGLLPHAGANSLITRVPRDTS